MVQARMARRTVKKRRALMKSLLKMSWSLSRQRRRPRRPLLSQQERAQKKSKFVLMAVSPCVICSTPEHGILRALPY